MQENFRKILEKLKIFIKHFMFYLIFALSLAAGFFIGYYYNTIKSYAIPKKQEMILKTDVKIAIDENNNMLVINKKDGTYITYQDSIGYIIFNFYAKNIWGQNNQPK